MMIVSLTDRYDVVILFFFQIVERYDVVLVQEIRDMSEESVYKLLNMLSG